ncbi:MAG: hypothetical protein KBF51_13505 [Chitinophagales bacterium]|nr:hypothetical protein [Chitinophagales bacterium]MBP9190547.1 hypothetical protein [Chitinophagales bacterium]
MKLIMHFFSIIILCSCISQHKEQVFEDDNLWNALIFSNQIEVPIYNNTDRNEILIFIKNDTLTEDYFLIEVIENRNGMAKINAVSGLSRNEIITGWIDINFLGIYTRPRNDIGSVPIYQMPNENRVIFDLNTNKILKIIDIINKWFKITNSENGVVKDGWLSPSYQCPNPYSTCN